MNVNVKVVGEKILRQSRAITSRLRLISKTRYEPFHDLANAILSNDDDDRTNSNRGMNRRYALSKAITLIESKSPLHREKADLLLSDIFTARQQQQDRDRDRDSSSTTTKASTCNYFRVGITGPPGAGKSSFIEAFGQYLLDELPKISASGGKDEEAADADADERPDKLAVICIDPSSVISGGSILGDKTRMTELSRHQSAYVRPSPSKGVLGGLSSYTNECCSLCEAAGYDLILVETVGLGQSEVDVSQVCDMIILMVPPGGGDNLQGAKKGILEVSDMLIVNKADGNLLHAARTTATEYKAASSFFRPRTEGWPKPPVLLASSETPSGMAEIWTEICRFRKTIHSSGDYKKKRMQQRRYWLWRYVQELIERRFHNDELLKSAAGELEHDLDLGSITPRRAAAKLLELSTRGLHEHVAK
mmetsp:Transcript_19608/g.29699  ORF Transcript_19608/g.29699 Transcript_19608/m.29699 type:complete len:420 (-) Transcript_19608:99-1358(-)